LPIKITNVPVHTHTIKPRSENVTTQHVSFSHCPSNKTSAQAIFTTPITLNPTAQSSCRFFAVWQKYYRQQLKAVKLTRTQREILQTDFISPLKPVLADMLTDAPATGPRVPNPNQASGLHRRKSLRNLREGAKSTGMFCDDVALNNVAMNNAALTVCVGSVKELTVGREDKAVK